MDSPGSAYTRFGFELFKELNKTKEGNIFFSPAGMSTAIGMLLLGAQGATSTQLQKILCSEKDTESSRVKTEEKEEERHVLHLQYGCFLDVDSLGKCIEQVEVTCREFSPNGNMFVWGVTGERHGFSYWVSFWLKPLNWLPVSPGKGVSGSPDLVIMLASVLGNFSNEDAYMVDEIEKTEDLHHQFQRVLSEISKPTNDYELKIVNRLFGEKTYLFLQKYLDYVEKYYHASMETVDFANAPDESRKKINSWVENQTHEKIKDLFSDDSISNSTKLVVVNIVYFKGQWDREFKKENTKEEAFWLNKTVSKPVPMMTQRDSFRFIFLEDLQARILEIPYRNNDLSMFVLLPNEVDGLEKIIDKLTPEKLVEWTNPGQMEERSVSLHLPRFEVEDSYDLEAVLTVLGMEAPSQEQREDSAGMCSQSGLQPQKFLHKSFVVVTEEGTEAGAGTGVNFAVTLAPGDESFHCSHPFLFFIRQSDSDSILFFGRFSSP